MDRRDEFGYFPTRWRAATNWKFCPLCMVGIASQEKEVWRKGDEEVVHHKCLRQALHSSGIELPVREIKSWGDLQAFLERSFILSSEEPFEESAGKLETLQHVCEVVFGAPISISQIQQLVQQPEPVPVSPVV